MSYLIHLDTRISELLKFVKDTTYSPEYEYVLNPAFATEFPSKAAASEWMARNTKEVEYYKLVESKAARAKFTEWANTGMPHGRIQKCDPSISYEYTNESPDEVLAWRIKYNENSEAVKYDHYKTWPDLNCVFRHLWHIGNYSDYTTEVTTTAVEICVPKNSEFALFEVEINKVMHICSRLDEDGGKIFPVFDHYLCENGNSVNLIIYPDGTAKVDGRWREHTKRVSLEQAFNYLEQHRYYGQIKDGKRTDYDE